MKNLIYQFLNGKSALQIFSILFLSLFLASCASEEMDPQAEYDLLTANSEASEKSKGAPAPSDNSIAALAQESGLTELVAALKYVDEEPTNAGLVDLFSNSTDQYTVFAPSNEAFEALYEVLGDDVDDIRDLDRELVLNVLLYHVTDGRRASNSVVPPRNSRTIETLLEIEGEFATFQVLPDLTIKDNLQLDRTISIQKPNVSASNGIVHVIDGVLIPITEL